MIKNYLLKQLCLSFFPIFLTLFLISSIIVLFQIARFTAYVELELYDLFKLYLLMSVKLLIFSLPISFFLAIGSAFKRLSGFNESLIFFALGLSPARLGAVLMGFAAAFSAALCAISIFFIPASFNLYDNFIDYKKTLAKISLNTSNYGRQIGEWIYYSNPNSGSQITIINPKTHQVIIAADREIKSEGGRLILELLGVQILSADALASSERMQLESELKAVKFTPQSALSYWSDFRASSKELVIYLGLSLLPFAGALWAASFGIYYERLSPSRLQLFNFIYLALYFFPIASFHQGHFYTISALLVGGLALSLGAFKIRLKNL